MRAAPRSVWLGVVLAMSTWLLPPSSIAWAQDAEALRKAAGSFDAGSVAYRESRFDLAASHFEAADEAVPSARVLRMAMRARLKAKQFARATTHAAQALERYPNDAKTTKLARGTIAEHGGKLHRIEIRCATDCVLALGTRAVPGLARQSWVVFVAAGEVRVGASFVDGTGADQQRIDAVAGGKNSLSFIPAGVSQTPSPTSPSPKPATGVQPAPGGTSVVAPGDPEPPAGGDDGGGSFITSPGVFIGLAVVTAGLGGVTVWSGLDTVNDPGADTVREVCRGQGTACPEYQQGLDKQLRTNVLIGATAGTAALSLVFAAFVTDWGGSDEAADGGADDDGAAASAAQWSLQPRFGLDATSADLAIHGSF